MNIVSRRSALAMASAALSGGAGRAPAEETYPPEVAGYLRRLYAREGQPLAFRENYPGGFPKWQQDARAGLRLRLGLDKIGASAGSRRPTVELGEPAVMDGYTRQRGVIETEPEVRLPFWFLKPEGKGPWPLGIFPHGHSATGHDTSAGVYAGEAARKRALEEERDVAVQAVKMGLAAIAPAVRGLSWVVPDLKKRVGTDCRSHAVQCLLAGRTAMGERVWDMGRLLDWAVALPEVDRRHILSMGNSGGGMVTIFLAACDQRVTVAVPSCSFSPTVSERGYSYHCPCNTVPGVMELGGLPHVAGLIAPRRLLTVNGRQDALFSNEAVESAAAAVRAIYRAAGHGGRFEHRWGDGGHRFYKDLMWPFIRQAFSGRG